MLGEITKLLLASALVLQITSPATDVVSDDEGGESINLSADDPANQSEDELETLVESDIDEMTDGEIEDEVLNKDANGYEELDDEAPDTDKHEVELDDEVSDTDIREVELGGETEVIETPEAEVGTLNEDRPTTTTIPQTSIEAMQVLIASNSANNPFTVPTGLAFNEAIKALDWGEGITVRIVMSGFGATCGLVVFRLNEQINEFGIATYDDEYVFESLCIYYTLENPEPIPQPAIEAMQAFIENNSLDDPLIIPTGLNINEAITALSWGENITAVSNMSGYNQLEGSGCGSISLLLNKRVSEDYQVTYDGIYTFADICLFYEVENSITKPPNSIPQCSIEAMRAFIEDNSADNPLIVPPSFTFTEALNELEWGEGITVRASLSGLGTGRACGSIALLLNEYIAETGLNRTFDDAYSFGDICIYYEFESQRNNESTILSLPQTGSRALNASLTGGGILAATGLIVYFKNKNKD